MRKKFSFMLCLLLFITIFLPNGSIPVSIAASPDIIVAKDGTGNFKTVQAAIDSVPTGTTEQTVILVRNGTYQEVVTIKKDNIYLIGESNTGTKITYGNYAGKLKSDGTTYGTSGSASFYLYGKNCILENIAIENSFDENTNTTGKQAVAAYIHGDRNIIKNCIITGNQDTLYANSGRQYYINCKIVGDTDFIFGGATAVFENCDIVSTVRGGYITAASTDIANYGYLFLNCNLTSDAAVNSTYLGRPWRPDAYVVYKTCYLGAHIKNVGWTTMSNNSPENARFFEYKSTGPGAAINSSRRQLSDSQAAQFTTQNLLKGSDNWNPSALTVSPTPLNGVLIKSLIVNDVANSANWSIQPNLQVGDNVFGDRAYKFVTVPNGLLGSELIRTACDSKAFTAVLASFTTKADVSVYVGLDSRNANIPSWLGNWTKTDESLTDDGSPSVVFNLFKKDFSSNSKVELGSNGTSNGVVNYVVVIKEKKPNNIIYGDLNGDGIANSIDFALMRTYLLGVNSDFPASNWKTAADVNADNNVNSIDFALMRSYLLGIITKFPAEM